jgi:hypothetical protein
MNIPLKLCLSSFARRRPLLFTHARAPNIRSLFRSGLLWYHASWGVFLVLECTRTLCKNTAWTSAADQYTADNADPYRRARTVTANVPFQDSAPPFCAGSSAPVGSTTNSWLFNMRVRNIPDLASSPPWSHRIMPPSVCPYLFRKDPAVDTGGSFDFVKNTQTWRECSSTTRR